MSDRWEVVSRHIAHTDRVGNFTGHAAVIKFVAEALLHPDDVVSIVVNRLDDKGNVATAFSLSTNKIPNEVACPWCAGYVRGHQWIGTNGCSVNHVEWDR